MIVCSETINFVSSRSSSVLNMDKVYVFEGRSVIHRNHTKRYVAGKDFYIKKKKEKEKEKREKDT